MAFKERPMTDRTEYLADRLAQQRDQSLALFRSLTPDQWSTVVYGDEGSWDVRTMLAHFVWSEASMLKLIENILQGGSGSPDDFDLNRFNASRAAKTAELASDTLIDQFDIGRQATIDTAR